MKLNARTLLIAALAAVILYVVWKNWGSLIVEGYEAGPAKFGYTGPDDMLDYGESDVFGTTQDPNNRWENLSMRPEYKKAPGDTHVCKCGYPSKRLVDAYGGSWHRLTHMCAPCDGKEEPVQLGHWWTRKGCGDPTSRGLNIVPYCTRCGN
jgi:hypothetical protein